MSDRLSVEINVVLPEHPSICGILSTLDPEAAHNLIGRAFMKAFPAWDWQVVQGTGTWQSAKVAVIDVKGTQIAADAKLWFEEWRNLLGERGLIEIIKSENLRLARYEGADIYVLGTNPQHALDFVQITIEHRHHALCSLEDIQPWHFRESPDGYPFPWDHAECLAPEYHCKSGSVINSLRWLDRSMVSHRAVCKADYAQMEKKFVTQSFLNGDPPIRLPLFVAYPEAINWTKRLSREERWFHDWAASSASKHPLGRFWYLGTHDYVHTDGLHHVGFVPRAVRWPKRKIRMKGMSIFRLMERLQHFDRAVRHDFGWYFYMVHGNLITADEGRAIAEGIRGGRIHFEPRDEAVLMAWDNDPYCF